MEMGEMDSFYSNRHREDFLSGEAMATQRVTIVTIGILFCRIILFWVDFTVLMSQKTKAIKRKYQKNPSDLRPWTCRRPQTPCPWGSSPRRRSWLHSWGRRAWRCGCRSGRSRWRGWGPCTTPGRHTGGGGSGLEEQWPRTTMFIWDTIFTDLQWKLL